MEQLLKSDHESDNLLVMILCNSVMGSICDPAYGVEATEIFILNFPISAT